MFVIAPIICLFPASLEV